MRKLLAAGLAVALSLSLAPVASAQSSFPALSSSSSTGTNNVSKVQQVEDNFAKALQEQGHTRHSQHDRAAEKALQAAVDGNVAFTMEPNANFPGAATGQTVSDGYFNFYIRFPLEHIDTVLRNIDNAQTVLPGVALPFGIAVDEAQSLVYVAFVVPLSALF